MKPASGKSYSDVLRDVRLKVKPDNTGTEIRSIRQTRGGELLLELGNDTKDSKEFASSVETTLGYAGVMRSMVYRITLELLYLDGIMTKEGV